MKSKRTESWCRKYEESSGPRGVVAFAEAQRVRGDTKLLIQITFFDNFQLWMGPGCKCDVLELFQSVQNANALHIRPFEGLWHHCHKSV